MVLAPILTIKIDPNFDCFYCINFLKFQILVRGRFENDPHGRRGAADKIFFRKNLRNNILGKVTKMVMIMIHIYQFQMLKDAQTTSSYMI